MLNTVAYNGLKGRQLTAQGIALGSESERHAL